jgi:hypothetical protein
MPGSPSPSPPIAGRRWTYRWVTLAMLAPAFLSIAVAAERSRDPDPGGLIPLTRNEAASLLTSPSSDAGHRQGWSAWRRRHQHRAQQSHYQRQEARYP